MKTFLKIFIGLLLSVGLFAFAFYRTPQERAFAQALAKAKQADSTAALLVAQAYLEGNGTKQNTAAALQWYEQAAAQANMQAAFELARLYEQGQYVPADRQSALSYLQMAAQGGLPAAQYELAKWYEQGKEVEKHAGQALFWYRQAAASNWAAQEKVTQFAQQEPELSARMSAFLEQLQAAQKDDANAQLAVGQAYRKADPVLHNDEQAFYWFNKAWENAKLPQAALEMYAQYNQGEGVAQNPARAEELLAQAAQQQYPQAQYMLGEQAFTSEPARMEDAFAWFSNAAAQGHAPAQYMTGFMLLQGMGTQKSVALAIEFFEKAAGQNNDSAQYVLGQIYTKGLGVKKNRRKGYLWLERAAENGNQLAKQLLEQKKTA